MNFNKVILPLLLCFAGLEALASTPPNVCSKPHDWFIKDNWVKEVEGKKRNLSTLNELKNQYIAEESRRLRILSKQTTITNQFNLVVDQILSLQASHDELKLVLSELKSFLGDYSPTSVEDLLKKVKEVPLNQVSEDNRRQFISLIGGLETLLLQEELDQAWRDTLEIIIENSLTNGSVDNFSLLAPMLSSLKANFEALKLELEANAPQYPRTLTELKEKLDGLIGKPFFNFLSSQGRTFSPSLSVEGTELFPYYQNRVLELSLKIEELTYEVTELNARISHGFNRQCFYNNFNNYSSKPGKPSPSSQKSFIESFFGGEETDPNSFLSISRLTCFMTSNTCEEEIIETPLLIQFGKTSSLPEGTSKGTQTCNSIAVDEAGNIYCAGQTSTPIGEEMHHSYDRDAFVMKTNPQGEIQWIKQIGKISEIIPGGSEYFDICNDVTVDNKGSVYCAGWTRGSLGGTHQGEADAFVIKLSTSSGSVQWIKQFGTPEPEMCNSIALDMSGNVFCGGYTEGSLGESHSGKKDAMIAKLSPNGDVLWIKQIGASTGRSPRAASQDEECLDITTDRFGMVYCGGYTSGNLGETNGFFKEDPRYATEYSSDAFILKLGPDGSFAFLTQYGENSELTEGSTDQFESCQTLSQNSYGTLYCAGATTGNIGDENGGGTDIFILTFDYMGKPLSAKQVGKSFQEKGIDPSGNESCKALALDDLGNVFCAGEVRGNFVETMGGYSDAYIMKFSKDLELIWTKQYGIESLKGIGTNNDNEACEGLAINKRGYAICAGHTESHLADRNEGQFSTDIFILKANKDGELK